MEVIAPDARPEGGGRPAVGEDGRPLKPVPPPTRRWCMQIVDRLWNHDPGTTATELPFPAPKVAELNSPPELERMAELRSAYPPAEGCRDSGVEAFVRPTPAHLEHCGPAMLIFVHYMGLPTLMVISDDRNVTSMQCFNPPADSDVMRLANGTLCTGWFMERRREDSDSEGGDVSAPTAAGGGGGGGGGPTARQVIEATAMAESSGSVAQRQSVFLLEDVVAAFGYNFETKSGEPAFARRRNVLEKSVVPLLRGLPNQRIKVETLPVVRVRHILPSSHSRDAFNEDLDAVRAAVKDLTDTQGAPFGGLSFVLPHSTMCSMDADRYATFRMPWTSCMSMYELLNEWALGDPFSNFNLDNKSTVIRPPDPGLLSRLARVPVEHPGGTTYHFHIRVVTDPHTTPQGKERLELTPVWKTVGRQRGCSRDVAVAALALAIARARHAPMRAWSDIGPSLEASVPSA